jgi:hypothetical protein
VQALRKIRWARAQVRARRTARKPTPIKRGDYYLEEGENRQDFFIRKPKAERISKAFAIDDY